MVKQVFDSDFENRTTTQLSSSQIIREQFVSTARSFIAGRKISQSSLEAVFRFSSLHTVWNVVPDASGLGIIECKPRIIADYDRSSVLKSGIMMKLKTVESTLW